jgi:hypothetical protein
VRIRRRRHHGVASFLKALPRLLLVSQKRQMESQLATAQSVGFGGTRYTMVGASLTASSSSLVRSCRPLADSLGVYECNVHWSMPSRVGAVLPRSSSSEVTRLWSPVPASSPFWQAAVQGEPSVSGVVSWRCRPCGVEFLL